LPPQRRLQGRCKAHCLVNSPKVRRQQSGNTSALRSTQCGDNRRVRSIVRAPPRRQSDKITGLLASECQRRRCKKDQAIFCSSKSSFAAARIDHLRAGRSTTPSKLAEQSLSHAAPCPPYKAIIDRRVWTVLRRTIAPATAALQHMQDAADDPPVVHSIHATQVCRKPRRNCCHCSLLSQNKSRRIFSAPGPQRISNRFFHLG